MLFYIDPELWEVIAGHIWWAIQKFFKHFWPLILTKILQKIIYPKSTLEMLKNRKLRCFWVVATLAYCNTVATAFVAAI